MIIGIGFTARVGKDTVAEMLGEEIFKEVGQRFVLMAYAQELKLRVQRDFDLRYEQLWGGEKEVEDQRYPKSEGGFWTPREILQTYGEFFRSINKQFWVDNLFKVIENNELKNVIVTDVRHPNEADPIVDRGGYVIKVTSNRTGKEKIHGSNHISETAMDNYNNVDFHIQNNGTLQELRQTVKQVVQFIKESERLKEKMEVRNG
jgi:hypothetical protein